jgi:hypothetical protein
MSEKRVTSISGQMVFMTLVLMMASAGWAQNHDLVMVDAPDVTSTNSADWKSPDLKIGADFGDTSVPDIIRRGVPNSVYARFLINGIQDYTIPSRDVKINLYWRNASAAIPPPQLNDSSWNAIGELSATYTTSDGPFAITRVWPTDFPSVTTKSLSWTPLVSGDYYHIAADVNYTSTTIVDENPDDNIAISLYESQSGLLDVVLLLDTSGSMGVYSYGGYSYMELAKQKAAVFINSMNDNHRFAVVAFSCDYTGDTKDVYPTPASLVLPDWGYNKLNATLAIGGLSDGGLTPLGAGLNRAIQVLTTSLTR